VQGTQAGAALGTQLESSEVLVHGTHTGVAIGTQPESLNPTSSDFTEGSRCVPPFSVRLPAMQPVGSSMPHVAPAPDATLEPPSQTIDAIVEYLFASSKIGSKTMEPTYVLDSNLDSQGSTPDARISRHPRTPNLLQQTPSCRSQPEVLQTQSSSDFSQPVVFSMCEKDSVDSTDQLGKVSTECACGYKALESGPDEVDFLIVPDERHAEESCGDEDVASNQDFVAHHMASLADGGRKDNPASKLPTEAVCGIQNILSWAGRRQVSKSDPKHFLVAVCMWRL